MKYENLFLYKQKKIMFLYLYFVYELLKVIAQ